MSLVIRITQKNYPHRERTRKIPTPPHTAALHVHTHCMYVFTILLQFPPVKQVSYKLPISTSLPKSELLIVRESFFPIWVISKRRPTLHAHHHHWPRRALSLICLALVSHLLPSRIYYYIYLAYENIQQLHLFASSHRSAFSGMENISRIKSECRIWFNAYSAKHVHTYVHYYFCLANSSPTSVSNRQWGDFGIYQIFMLSDIDFHSPLAVKFLARWRSDIAAATCCRDKKMQ